MRIFAIPFGNEGVERRGEGAEKIERSLTRLDKNKYNKVPRTINEKR